MKTNFTRKPLALVLLALGSAPAAWATTPPASSPYGTDPQNSHVQDQTSEGLSNLNTVLCIMDSIKPADMVNKGNYIALVDMNKCDTSNKSSSSDSSGASSAPNYMTAVVNVTRASNSDPMIGKMWMSMTEHGQAQNIFVHLTATKSPTDAPPYGVFHVDYLGKDAATGVTGFNGFVDANGANISSLENDSNGGGSGTNALALIAPDTSSGSGTMNVMDYSGNRPAQVTFNFAYDSDETANGFPKGIFRRDRGGSNNVCFDRSKAAAHTSVWRYGTYNATDGSRVDQANPGFPVQASYHGTTYWGYASYWGVNFQGLDMNSFPDGALSGVTITDQRPGNTTTYSLSKNRGKLTKWTQHSATLADLDGVPFNFWGDLTGLTSSSLPANPSNSWVLHWDNANSKFVVEGMQSCGNNGCTTSSITSVDVLTTAFNNTPMSGWAMSFGGNITIPPNNGNAAHAGGDAVNYYSQSDVVPGSAGEPTALHCLNNCPTSADMGSFNTGGSSPFNSATTTQWGMGSTAVAYTFSSGGLADGTGPLAGIITDTTKYSGQFQNGVMSGRLYDDNAANAADHLQSSGCPNSSTYCEPGNPSVYYTWQTGPNQWSQSMWLTKTSDSSLVSFDPPETIAYTVPSDATTYGTWAGKTLQLQFNGFGNLQGIPGSCVNPLDNTATDCSTAGARYVPAFSIPDGATMTLAGPNSTSIPLIVKALDAEVRLNKVACSSVSIQLPASPLTLPTAGLHDPSSSADTDYLGTEPTVTDPPKVIDGVMQ